MNGHNSKGFQIFLPLIQRCSELGIYKYPNTSKVSINNIEFYKQTNKQIFKSQAGADEYTGYYTIKNNQCYHLAFGLEYYPLNFSKTIINQEKNNIDQIISTFKFTK